MATPSVDDVERLTEGNYGSLQCHLPHKLITAEFACFDPLTVGLVVSAKRAGNTLKSENDDVFLINVV